MNSQKGGSGHRGESQRGKIGHRSESSQNSETKVNYKKDPIETWLSGLGFNPEPSEMEALLATIRGNSKLEFYFNTLKNYVNPIPKANKIRKYYLYCILKGGSFGFDIPKQFRINGQNDIKFYEKYLKCYNKIKAFEIVKQPEASKLLKDLSKGLDKEKQVKDCMLNHFIVQTDRLNSLSCLERKLASLKSEIVSFEKVIRVVNGTNKGSENFQLSQTSYFLQMEQILNIPSQILMEKSEKEIIALVLNYFKSLSNELKAFLKDADDFSLDKFVGSIHDLPDPQEGTMSVHTNDVIKHFLKINTQVVMSVQTILLNAKNFKTFLTDFSTNYESKKHELVTNMKICEDKLSNLKNEIIEFVNVFKDVSKVENTKLIRLDDNNSEKYLQIEAILNELGTSFNSTLTGSVLMEKQQIITLYKRINSYPNNLCCTLTSINFNEEWLKPFTDVRCRYQESLNQIAEIINTKSSLPSSTRLITYMPFVNINGIPIIDVMEKVKELIIEKKMYDLMPL